MPFALRRPQLLFRDLIVNRDSPNLAGLESVADPEAFVWKILPHAARTFSACIALLPAPLARASAVAYLYCRCLDTYEDLIVEPEDREAALGRFVNRFRDLGKPAQTPEAAPSIDADFAKDARDRTHVILVNRISLVDQVFEDLGRRTREIILDLVRGMSEGMIWSSTTFVKQKGVLTTSSQLRRYCDSVLGLPTIFAARLLTLYHTDKSSLRPSQEQDALRAGEMIQLANITRDIEKDLRRGVAYHPGLSPFLGDSADGDTEVQLRIREVRSELLIRALRLAPAYRRFVEGMGFTRLSLGRASAVLMLLFTDRYYRSCADRLGKESWKGPRSGLAVILKSVAAAFFPSFAMRTVRGVEASFLRFAKDHEAMPAPEQNLASSTV